MIRALVFDFDGVLVDSEVTHVAVWRDAFRAHGCDFTVEEWSTCLGTTGGFDPATALRARSRIAVAEGTEALVHRRYQELVRSRGLMPGVVDWLDAARVRGLGTAIASSSRREWVGPFVDELGLRGRIDQVICYDGSIPAKPAPDLYLAACAALGAAPQEAVAVEDSPNGVAAAVAAGLFCVVVTHAATDARAADRADLVLPTLEAVPLAEVLAVADRRQPRAAAQGGRPRSPGGLSRGRPPGSAAGARRR